MRQLSGRNRAGRNPVWLILAFLLPLIGMWIGFAVCRVHPFGDMQMLYSDLREQYYPFLQEFQARLKNGESLFWSWNGGLGTDFWSLIAYYIASPLNLLSVFVPAAALRDFLAFTLTVKIGCAGLFFALLLKKVFRRNDFSITLFGWMYAFCSFIMGYYWDIIWMDTVALLPLIILGLYALITEGKFRLYTLSLFVAVAANYYIGAFVCYFCVIAFFSIAAIKQVYGRDFLSRLGQFALSSLLGGGLTAFLLLHAAKALSYTDSAGGSALDPKFYDNYLEVIGNLFAFNRPTVMSGLPNLYCGVLPLLLIVVFLRAKKISLEDKIIHCVFLVFFIFATNFNVLDYILHGFHFPNMLPARYSFLISFVLLLVGYRAFLLLKDISSGDLIGMGFLAVGLLGLSCISLGKQKLLANVILVSAYLLFLFLYERRFLTKRTLNVFLSVLIIGELAASLTLSMDAVGKTSYKTYPYKEKELTGLYQELRAQDPTFWRSEMTCRYYLNDGMFYRYAGVGQFSSTANRHVRDMMNGLAFTNGANSYYYNYSSPLTNSLLGLKYFVSRGADPIEGTYAEYLNETEGLKIYRNTAYLGTGFMVDEKILDFEFTNSPFQVQNTLFHDITQANGQIFRGQSETSYEGENFLSLEKTGSGTYAYTTDTIDEATLTLTYKTTRTGTYYAYMRIGGGGKIRVTNSSGESWDHPLDKLRYIAPIGTAEAGDTLTVEITADANSKDKTISFYFYYFDEMDFRRGLENLSDEVWNVDEYTDTMLKGKIDVLQDGILYTSVPYTEGWTLYVDGEETEIIPLLDEAMIGARLTAGTHTVELRYTPEYLWEGVIVSAVCLLLFLALCFIFRNGFPLPKKKSKEPLPEPVPEALNPPEKAEKEISVSPPPQDETNSEEDQKGD